MASTLSATAQASIIGIETLDATAAPFSSSDSDRKITTNALNKNVTRNSASTPALEKAPLVQEITISGTTTIDLTAAPLAAGREEDMTGKKLIMLQIVADPDNAGDVTIAPGASNPYPLFGAGNERDFVPGESAVMLIDGVASGKPAVSSTVKTIDITGTTDDVIKIILYFGT